VLVLPQEGHAEHGVVIGRAWSDQARTPPAPSGEFWLVHQTGSFLKLTADGAIRLNGEVFVTGNVRVTGNITATGHVRDGHGALADLRTRYNAHTHSDPQGGTSSPPTPRD
jgi:phage gp45-like